MNAIIYVFSGTGNTRRICSLYKEEFEANGVATTLYDVKGALEDLPDPNGFDLVGFAYPIHGFNAPHIMLDLAKMLPCVEKKRYFVLKSSGEPIKLNNISSLKMNGILKRKGYVLQSEYHYVMPYNMIFRHTDDVATHMWRTAKALAPIEAREVLAGKSHLLEKVAFGHAIAWLFRIEHPAMRVNGRMFRVDAEKCIHCGKCQRVCPMGNIRIGEDGKFSFGGKCLMCTRCSFGCPTDAFNIAMLNGWRINGNYNMDYDGEPQPNKHAKYCKKAYIHYFENADKKIAEAQKMCGVNQDNVV